MFVLIILPCKSYLLLSSPFRNNRETAAVHAAERVYKSDLAQGWKQILIIGRCATTGLTHKEETKCLQLLEKKPEQYPEEEWINDAPLFNIHK